MSTLEEAVQQARESALPPPESTCPDCSQPVEWPAAICNRCLANRERRKRVDAALKSVPPNWEWCRFGAPEMAQKTSGGPGRIDRGQAIAEAMAARDAHKVVLHGPSGVGKTSLVVAMLRARLEVVDVSCFFVMAYALGRARAGYEDSDPRLVRKALTAQLLVLDDLGNDRELPSSPIVEVVLERHSQGKPLWVTTFLSVAAVKARYGDGFARWVFERAQKIECDGGAAR